VIEDDFGQKSVADQVRDSHQLQARASPDHDLHKELVGKRPGGLCAPESPRQRQTLGQADREAQHPPRRINAGQYHDWVQAREVHSDVHELHARPGSRLGTVRLAHLLDSIPTLKASPTATKVFNIAEPP